MEQKLKEQYDESLNTYSYNKGSKGTLEPVMVSARDLYDPELVVSIIKVICPFISAEYCSCSSGKTDPDCLCSVVVNISNAVLAEVIKMLKTKGV